MQPLFATNNSSVTLSKFKTLIDGISPIDDFERGRNNLISLVTGSMKRTPDEWDKACEININWIGEQFINRLSSIEEDPSKTQLDEICSMCFRFLFEFYLSIKSELSMEFEAARNFASNNLQHFETSAKVQIEYAIREMPISIFKALANSEQITNIKDFNSVAAKAAELKDQWDNELSVKEAKVNKLRDSLSEYENGFNFVGLYQGFDDLASEKKRDCGTLITWLRLLAVVIVLPVIAEIFVIYNNIENISVIKEALLISVLPTISLMAISIYYFRVILHNFRSTKSQLLQLELRKTLCRFIQKYSEYSQEIRTKDSNPLEKFENIIFSGIVSDDEKLPSTYDGIEQIAKLIKSLKP
ncbi:hypothetical protein [Pseudomonas anguilliseptica]|uniref:hypothetical protein n=1 Tax=Pseudomonas anguilliseptica TaxID=53406 RepID=UPI0022AF00A6|nr:hypothetical protein [Pseudomonas anguilliseptica]MCZ4324392.1 hypothetical protein [Pseudomonas anguilliseptica]